MRSKTWSAAIYAIQLSAAVMALPAFGAVPDYTGFDEILMQNVRNGFVDYDGFRADPRFPEFLGQLAGASPADLATPAEKLALYINAYNALAIQGILDGYSPSSWWGRRRFFRRAVFEMLGETITLQELEHERIIPIGDPRIHFAIVCASLSCPRLSSRAYTPGRINFQLHDAARRFINDPTRNQFDMEHGIAFLSRIFQWYEDDFVRAGGSVQQYLSRFVDDAKVADALRAERFEIRYNDYDWSLNGYISNDEGA